MISCETKDKMERISTGEYTKNENTKRVDTNTA
jgi:hypothetical protein